MRIDTKKVRVSPQSGLVKHLLSVLARIGTLSFGLMLSSVALVALASAATITVGNAGDSAMGNGARCNVANTCTLRDAIAKAASVTGPASGDTIVFSLPVNSTITLSGSDLRVGKNVTIDGSAVTGLAISGDNQSRVFEINSGVTVTLNQLVIREGYADQNSGGGIANSGTLMLIDSTVANNTTIYGRGGGIDNDDGASLTLIGSTVSGNKGSIGGGIANRSGSVTLTLSTVENNTATSDGGGGLFNTMGRVILTSTTVKDNKALSGGGIENWGLGTVMLTDCTISGNFPGGISNSSGSMTLTDSLVASNTTRSGSGGGINNHGTMMLTGSAVANNTVIIPDFYGRGGGIHNTGTLALASSTVSGNTVSGNPATSSSGGGIYNAPGVTLTLSDSTISNNRAATDYGSGGGISNEGILTITNTTVSGNTTGSHGVGGGIAGGNFILINSTVADNTAGSHGGGIYTSGATLVQGTIANNTAAGINSDVYNANYLVAVNTIIHRCEVDGSDTTALTDNGGNLDGGSGCGFTDASSASNASLELGALADNGGPTLTLLPAVGSDAIGHGVLSVCTDAPVNSRDQRGFARSAVRCTSGAVEPGVATIDARFSGQWYDPARSGEGIVLEILDPVGAAERRAAVYFFTYPPAGDVGQQAWMYGVGTITEGGIAFDDMRRPQRVGDASGETVTQQSRWGRLWMSFDDCLHGRMRWEGPPDWGNADVPLQRLTTLEGLGCNSDPGAPPIASSDSGIWAANPDFAANSGFVVEQTAPDRDVMFWFDPGSVEGGQRWMIGIVDKPLEPAAPLTLLRGVGPRFGINFDPAAFHTIPGMLLSEQELGCDSTGSASLRFYDDAGQVLLDPIQLSLGRVTRPAGIPGCPP